MRRKETTHPLFAGQARHLVNVAKYVKAVWWRGVGDGESTDSTPLHSRREQIQEEPTSRASAMASSHAGQRGGQSGGRGRAPLATTTTTTPAKEKKKKKKKKKKKEKKKKEKNPCRRAAPRLPRPAPLGGPPARCPQTGRRARARRRGRERSLPRRGSRRPGVVEGRSRDVSWGQSPNRCSESFSFSLSLSLSLSLSFTRSLSFHSNSHSQCRRTPRAQRGQGP